MIDIYSWTTGNARKVYIMLEETGLDYRVHPVNINKRDQFKPNFLVISPNNKIPAIIDQEGPGGTPYSMFESGAILMYLADKTGEFLPDEPMARSTVLQWLMFQMGDLGPMFGQAGHFVSRKNQPGMGPALTHFTEDADRLMWVIDGRLADNAYIAGDEYSIADMAIFPWCQDWGKRDLRGEDYPNFMGWFKRIQARPAIIKADEVSANLRATYGAAD